MPHWWEGDTKEGFTVEEVFKLGLVDRFAVEKEREKEEQSGKWHTWDRTSSRLFYRHS